MDHHHDRHQLHQQQDLHQDVAGNSGVAAATTHEFIPAAASMHPQNPNYNLPAHQKQSHTEHLEESVAVEREILNYPTLVLEQQVERELLNYPSLVLEQQLEENYEHHHQHEHDAYYSTEDTPRQHTQDEGMDRISYPVDNCTYETAIEAVKPAYNIMLPYDTAKTAGESDAMVDSAQNNDAVNALIGEYFGQTEGREGHEENAHDHSHAHTQHSVVADRTTEHLDNTDQAMEMNQFGYSAQQQIHETQHIQQMAPQQTHQHIGQLQQPQQQIPLQTQHIIASPTQLAPTENSRKPQNSHTLPSPKLDAIQARQTMNTLLREQAATIEEVERAEEELERAKAQLEKAKRLNALVEERVRITADSLTESLLKEDTRWNRMYTKLREFKEKHGHCDVLRNPYRSMEKRSKRNKDSLEQNEIIALGTWVGQARLDARRPIGHPDRLEPYKVIALSRLGFDWHPRENYWMDMYEQLRLHLEQNNGKMPPRTINSKKNPLGQWCDTQLENYRQFNRGNKKAYITQEKIDLLNQIGFVWDKTGKLWMDNYEKLKQFKLKHGHCNAVPSLNGGDRSFGLWVSKQKRKYQNYKRGERKETVTEKQAALLEEIDFEGTNLESSKAASQVVDAVIMNQSGTDDSPMINAENSLIEEGMQYR